MTHRRTVLLLAALAAVSATAATARDSAEVRYRARLELGPEGPGPVTTIAFLSVSGPDGRPKYWAAERVHDPLAGPAPPRLWADSRTCPALAQVIIGLTDTSLPDETAPLRAPMPGRVTITGPITRKGPKPLSYTDNRGPLAAWWSQMEAQLVGCWKATAVEVNGRPMDWQLGRWLP